MAAVEVQHLTKSWKAWWGPGRLALDRLSLSIPSGAAFGLIGPNGAGKTTFIKLLLGVVRPTSGSLRVLGGDPEELSVRQRIGYLPERLHLPAALKARDILRSVATLKRLSPGEGELVALLDRVGLEDTRRLVGTFSKGMRQRLGLAVALLGQPELLILDEPTDGIDPLGRVDVRGLLIEEKRRGATILLNSHLLAETERVCDRIAVLHQGVLRIEGSLEEVTRGSTRWLARFASPVDPAALEAAGFSPESRGWVFAGSDVDALNAAIDRARAQGARLIELVPARVDLEAVLAGALEARP